MRFLSFSSLLLACGSLAFTATTLLAEPPPQPSAAEAKLREGLRNTMLQLRTMQGERDALQIEKTTLEGEKTDLTTKLEALTKQAAVNQETAQQNITALEAKITAQNLETAQLKDALEKWKKSQKEAVELATKKEDERAKTAGRIVVLDRQVEDQLRKNAAMYKVGIEVLNRYEKFVLGDAIASREPFTGIARVKFQTLAQDFRDQLTDERIKIEAPKTPEKAPAAKADAKPAAKKTEAKPVDASTIPAIRKPEPKAAPEKPTTVQNARS